MFSADILAEGVSGLVPKPFGIATEKESRVTTSAASFLFVLILQSRTHLK